MLPEATYDGIRSHTQELRGGHVQVWLSSKPPPAGREMTAGQPERRRMHLIVSWTGALLCGAEFRERAEKSCPHTCRLRSAPSTPGPSLGIQARHTRPFTWKSSNLEHSQSCRERGGKEKQPEEEKEEERDRGSTLALQAIGGLRRCWLATEQPLLPSLRGTRPTHLGTWAPLSVCF